MHGVHVVKGLSDRGGLRKRREGNEEEREEEEVVGRERGRGRRRGEGETRRPLFLVGTGSWGAGTVTGCDWLQRELPTNFPARDPSNATNKFVTNHRRSPLTDLLQTATDCAT